MKKLSIVIMAHPTRAKFIPYLKEKLGDVPVVYDEKNNIWDTCRRAWLAHDLSAEYALVIQDDAIICDNFIEQAETALKEDHIYSFFAGKLLASRIRYAMKNKQNVVFAGMIFNEIALCMLSSRVKDMVHFCDDRQARTDQEIARWARLRKLQVCYPIPSLVDHRDGKSIYTKNYNRPKPIRPRKAYFYIGNEKK